MRIRAIVSGLAIGALVSFAASAATLSGTVATPDGVSAQTAAPADTIDLGMLKSFVGGKTQLFAQMDQACQKATMPCDDQHPCCKGLSCVSNLFDKTKVCDFRG